MRGRRTKVVMAVLLCTLSVFVCGVSADEPLQIAADQDYRIDVGTNRRIYHDRDVLQLTVKLLNEDPGPLEIVREPITIDENQQVTDELFPAFLDDRDVDVEIRPNRLIVIGYATLMPLGPGPADSSEKPQPSRAFPLPLFGPPLIAPHSTRIISMARILIAHPPKPQMEELREKPAEEAPEQTESDSEEPPAIDLITAVGRYIALKPGYYLLDCHVNRIGGTKVAQAQKIIEIRGFRRPLSAKLLEQNTRMLRRLEERSRQTATVTGQIQQEVRLYGRIQRFMLRYLLRPFLPSR